MFIVINWTINYIYLFINLFIYLQGKNYILDINYILILIQYFTLIYIILQMFSYNFNKKKINNNNSFPSEK